jgi:hypothetical protein
VDDDGRAVIEINNQVFGATAYGHDFPAGNSGNDIPQSVVAEHAGKVGETEAEDAPADDAVDERAANGFDFREFWHTQ